MTALHLDGLDVLVKATALLIAAALADAALARRGSAATRHLVWSLAIAALLALPAALVALPQWQIRIPVERAAIVTAAEQLQAMPSNVFTPGVRTPAVSVQNDAADPVSDPRPAGALIVVTLAALYLAGAFVLLARLAVEPFALRRLTRQAVPLSDDSWRALFETCAGQVGVHRPVRLLRSGREVMPLTFGTIAPAIVLPASSDEWVADRRRAVLLHELAHISRRDCLVQRLTALACALYWPHPGVWWAARRLRVERELACDDRVLAAGAGARDYAGHLLELAHSLGAAPAPATALGMARAQQLERRLLAILDAARNRGQLRRFGLAAAVAVAGVVFVSMAVLHAAIVARDPAVPSEGVSFSAAAVPQQEFTGTWELRRTQDPQVIQISIRTARGSHGRSIRLDRLAGLPVDQIDAANARVSFPIRRDAGTFTIDGVCHTGVCGGTFAFAPDPAFADALVKRGIGRPTPADQFALAIADAGLAYLDALAAAGYAKPDLQTLVRAAEHGVDADYLQGMTALGYTTGALDGLIRLRDHGVDPGFIRGLQAAGYAHLSADELLNARDHGADPGYARDMAALGFRNLPLPQLINARDHGVDPQYVRDMQALGHKLALDEYLRTRDHGVDPGYVRGLASLGYTGLDIDALVKARGHGVDPGYVRGMAEVGYKGVPLDDLIRMRDHGVDPEFVRRVQRGGGRLSVDEIIQRRDRGGADTDDTVRLVAARIGSLWRTVSAWLRG